MERNTNKKKLVKFCFDTWRQIVKRKKEKQETMRRKLEQKEKLDNLVRAIKKYKKEKEECVKINVPKSREPLNNFKNRFQAQKSTIERLTMKLEAKDRVIEDLKLGIFDKEAFKSLNETKIEIREIFANCSTKVQCKIPPPQDYNEQFMIQTQKAPKIIQELEERALERAQRREIILERKRIIQENRQRIIAEALERKKIQDEDEKKRNLEKMKEHRRKEMEKQKIRQTNKLIFVEKLKLAIVFYNRNLMKKGFRALSQNCSENKENYQKSVAHYKIALMRKVIMSWKDFVEEKYRDKNELADAVCAKNILSRALKIWIEMRVERMRSMQVAEDFYDLLLVDNTFVHWHRYVCIQIMQMEKKMKLAKLHHDRRLLFHYFYQWRSLRAVLQLEKSKELKMKKWREKVWAILPDYKPPNDDD